MKRLLKKFAAIGMAAMMIMAMGVTAFAAETGLEDGEYMATAHLYKDEACTEISMGDAALDGADISVSDGKATITLYTTSIKYMGITGHLDSMTLYSSDGTAYAATGPEEAEGYYIFTISDFPASELSEGVVLEGKYVVKVSIMPMNSTGFLKLTDIQ